MKKWVFFLLPTFNAWLLSTSLKAGDWWGHIFSAKQSTRLEYVCHPLPPMFMAVSMIPNMWHSSSCYCMRHYSWLTKFGVLCLNQIVIRRWPHPLLASGYAQQLVTAVSSQGKPDSSYTITLVLRIYLVPGTWYYTIILLILYYCRMKN